MQQRARFIYSVAAFSLLAIGLALAGCGSTPLTEVPPAMVGTWQGEATIIVAWVDQEMLPVTVTIHPDGSVEGAAGNATLVGGSLRKNMLGSPYIIMADLDGPIVAGEGIVRDGVKLPLDFEEDHIVGGLATTGTETGGKETMILTASNLLLTRVERE